MTGRLVVSSGDAIRIRSGGGTGDEFLIYGNGGLPRGRLRIRFGAMLSDVSPATAAAQNLFKKCKARWWQKCH